MLLRSVLAKALVDKGQWLTWAMLLQALFIQDESDAVQLHIDHWEKADTHRLIFRNEALNKNKKKDSGF